MWKWFQIIWKWFQIIWKCFQIIWNWLWYKVMWNDMNQHDMTWMNMTDISPITVYCLTDNPELMQATKMEWFQFKKSYILCFKSMRSTFNYLNLLNICNFWIKPLFEKYFGSFYQRFLSSAFFVIKTSGTFELLQNKLSTLCNKLSTFCNKLSTFRRWAVIQKRTKTILLRPKGASAPRKKNLQNFMQ